MEILPASVHEKLQVCTKEKGTYGRRLIEEEGVAQRLWVPSREVYAEGKIIS
jgi:hypothetical protein